MALAKCKECGQQVSNKAAACPGCGAPIKQQKSSLGCGGVFVIGIVLLFVVMCSAGQDRNKQAAAPASTGAVPRTTAPADGKQWATIRTTANVRSGPGTDHQVVKTLQAGERYRCFVPAATDTWVKCFEGQYIHKSLVDFSPAAASSSPPTRPSRASTKNPSHDQFLGLSDSERNVVFTLLVQSSGSACPAVTRNFHQGMDSSNSSFWNVSCSNGSSYVVMIEADAEGSSKTLDCAVMTLVTGVECFKRF
jgi:hypothetical protein